MHCPHCLRRQRSNGHTLSDHAAITPAIVCPGRAQGIALPPEYIMLQDGQDQQACERTAGKRWLANDAMATREVRHWNGRCTEVPRVRYLNDVSLRRGHDTLSVNGFELTVVNAKTGEQLSHNSYITTHRLTADNVVAVAQAGRGRWKIENENHHVLKTHLEQNFGHGKRYLAACLLSPTLLAFLFHTVLEWSAPKDALLRQVLAKRQTFFQDMQAFMRYMTFDHWDHLLEFMIRGLERESPIDTG